MSFWRKFLLRSVKIVVFLGIVALGYTGLKFLFVNDVFSMTRITFHEYYQDEKEIDTLFLGTSHTQRGLDAKLISDKLGRSCFNLGTTVQRMGAAYYLIQDAAAHSSLEQVYLEISPSVMTAKNNDEVSVYQISDYMKNRPAKLAYLTNDLPKVGLARKWSPLPRAINIEEGVSMEKIRANIIRKSSDAYKNYETTPEDYAYLGNGSWGNTGQYDWSYLKAIQYGGEGLQDLYVTPDTFDERQLEYWDKIVDLCREKEIALTFVIYPISDLCLMANPKEYDACSEFIRTYCEKNGIGFLDFNKVSREDLQLTDDCFMDADHLNQKGSEVFSSFVAELMAGEDSSVWYEAAQDRVETMDNTAGFLYQREDLWDENRILFQLTPIPEGEGKLQYTVWAAKDAGEKQIFPCRMTDGMLHVEVPMEYLGTYLEIDVKDENGTDLYQSHIWL